MLRSALLGLLAACSTASPVTIAITVGPIESDAARMAYDEAVIAGLSHPIDTLFMPATDTRAAPAIRSADMITSVRGIVAVVGPNNSAASLASAPVYNEHRVVQLSPVATAVLYSAAGPYSYRLAPSDDRQGRFIADHLLNTSADQRVALMYVNDDYGRGLRREVMRAIPANSIDWVIDVPHMENLTGTADARVAALAEVRPAVLLWLGRGAELEPLLPAIRAQLGDITIIGSDGSATQARSNVGGVWSGVHYVDLVDLDATPEIRAFRERYRKRFGREPSASDALSYDAMSVIIAAIQNGARTGTDVQEFLDELGTSRPGHPGVVDIIRFDSHGDVDRSHVLNVVPGTP
jgi:branched-chain amino acid transport system substrate-binding protein